MAIKGSASVVHVTIFVNQELLPSLNADNKPEIAAMRQMKPKNKDTKKINSEQSTINNQQHHVAALSLPQIK